MMVDSVSGLCVATGSLVNLSEGGCSILSKTHVDANLAGRLQVTVAGTELWIPAVTCWVRPDTRTAHWMIGWSFDRPTEEKQRLIRALLWERRRITRDSA
jgi:hypothetical protein